MTGEIMDHELIRRIEQHPLSRRVWTTCDAMGCTDADLIVSAMSGGGDSTALAFIMAPYAKTGGYDHVLAYFDHGIDPRRHEREWKCVEDGARRLGTRCIRGVSTDYEHIGGEGPEATWRNRRYAFLKDVAGERGVIVTGHTLEDNAESFLLAALRGGPGPGLGGIRLRRSDRVFRPLLRIHRCTLRDFLRSLNITWIDDPSNNDTAGARNYIRHCIMPGFMERFGPGVVMALHRSACSYARDNDFIDEIARDIIRNSLRENEWGELILDLTEIETSHVAVRHRITIHILDRIYRGDRISLLPHLTNLINVIAGDVPAANLPRGIRVRREDSRVVIIPPVTQTRATGSRETLPVPGLIRVPCLNGVIQTTMVWTPRDAAPVLPRNLMSAVVDADTLKGPLYVRNRKEGERFTPLGFSQGRVKLKKYLRDTGVSSHRRWSYPIVAERITGRLLWIPGVARSDIAPIGDHTRRYIYLRFISYR